MSDDAMSRARPGQPLVHVRFDAFEPAMSPILIPEGCVLMRGCDRRYPFPTHRPAYFTHDVEVARGYADRPGHALGYVETMRTLRVLDVRYMCSVLRVTFAKRLRVDLGSSDAIRTTTLAYGLSSLSAQLGLYRNRYREAMASPDAAGMALGASMRAMQDHLRAPDVLGEFPVEVPGIRVAETTNDAAALLVLQQLLGGIDGYVAPRTRSAFHVEQQGWAPAELVLFDPLASGIRAMEPAEIENLRRSDVRSLELVTLHGAHASMRPVNDGDGLGVELVWMRGGAKATGRATRSSPRARASSEAFDPCGIDRIPEAEYGRMCAHARRAAEAFGRSQFDTSHLDIWRQPAPTPAFGMPPPPTPISREESSADTPFAAPFPQVLRGNPRCVPGLHTNLLETMSDSEYEAFKKSVLGRMYTAPPETGPPRSGPAPDRQSKPASATRSRKRAQTASRVETVRAPA